jgi:antitoxin component YwqK of YwqJK toxin-antitoxin module
MTMEFTNIETRAEYMNGNLDGAYTRYDRYGSLLEEGTFNHGGKEGYYKSYHETGWPAKIERYIQGKLVYFEEFDEDGRPIIAIKSGQKNGGR